VHPVTFFLVTPKEGYDWSKKATFSFLTNHNKLPTVMRFMQM